MMALFLLLQDGIKASVVLAAIDCLQEIFTSVLRSGQLKEAPSAEDDPEEFSPEDKYKVWLNGCYGDAKTQMLALFANSDAKIQVMT
jgi:hypothetical protein